MDHNLGANIRIYRKNKGFTQEELANLLGVTPQAVSRWESEAGLPDIGLIIPMAQILGVTTDALFGYDKINQLRHVSAFWLMSRAFMMKVTDGAVP